MEMKDRIKKNKLLSPEFSQYSGIILVLIVLCILLSLVTDSFASMKNITNVMRQISITGVLAVGMSFAFIVSEIDLSVGSVVGFMGGLLTLMLAGGVSFPAAVLAVIALCIVIGGFNGLITTHFMIPSFVVTLAMEYMLRGGLYIMSGGTPITGLPEWLVDFGLSSFLGLPSPVWIMFAVFLAGWIILSRTTLGRNLFAIGGNIRAADYSGINVLLVKASAFVICSICAGIAAILQTARLGSAQPSAGTGMEMEAIVAACLGGMSMGGGYGSVIGVLMGTMLLGVISNGMVLMGIDSYYQQIVKGLIILGAVLYNMRSNRK